MRILIQSMRRLYLAGRISLDEIKALLVAGKIAPTEYDYIVGISSANAIAGAEI